MPFTVFAHHSRDVFLGVARCAAPFQTVGENILPGLLVKPSKQGCPGQFIDSFALGFPLRLQLGQQFV